MTQKVRTLETKAAPAAIGPYSQATVAGGFLFTAGQIPLDPKTGEVVEGDVEPQTTQVLANLAAVLKEAGATWSDVVKTTVFLRHMRDFDLMNDAYAEKFGNHRPARSTVAVVELPVVALVEIEAWAYRPRR
jgi:2-iminobutanoate/2-iminopropanoate deaminase